MKLLNSQQETNLPNPGGLGTTCSLLRRFSNCEGKLAWMSAVFVFAFYPIRHSFTWGTLFPTKSLRDHVYSIVALHLL